MKILTELNMMKNQIKNLVLHKLDSAPLNGVQGQVYFDTVDNTLKFHDGTNWVPVPKNLSQLGDDATHRLVTDTEKGTWNGKQNALQFMTTPSSSNKVATAADIPSVPTVPTALSELSDDSTHRTVTDTEKSNWNGKCSSNSPALTGTPTAPTAGASTNNTQIATTAFVKTAINNSVTSAISSNY